VYGRSGTMLTNEKSVVKGTKLCDENFVKVFSWLTYVHLIHARQHLALIFC
jgi:hypothetical protein